MNIGDVLGKPFKYIWKNSVLWALGMVTQIFSTIITFLVYYFVIVNLSAIQTFVQNAQLYIYRPDLLSRLFGNLTPEQILSPFLTIFTVVVLASLVSAVITEFMRCCIVQGICMADSTHERVDFKEILQQGWKPFGKLILQDIFWGVVSIILWVGLVFAIGGIGAGIGSGTNGAAGLIVLLCCVSCIAIPATFFLSILFPQMRVSLMHDNLGVFSSMGKGWHTFKKAFGWMLLVGLIIGAGSYILRLLSSYLTGIPLNLSVTMGFINVSQELQSTQIIMLVIFTLVGFFLNGYIFTYVNSVWTMAYRDVNYPPAPPAIPDLGIQTVSRDSTQPPAIPS